MSKDHFVAQTYLKRFGDNTLNGMLHAYRKSNGKTFQCWPKDVCHEWDGDLNPAFLGYNSALLGEFRAIFEPHWNPSVDSILQGQISPHDKFVVSAYMANLMTCTPAWRRVCKQIHDDDIKRFLIFSKEMQEKYGGNPDLPVEGIELIEQGKMTLDTDPNYIKAIVTKQLIENTLVTYNQNWCIVANDTAQPFLTSNNPVAILYSGKVDDPMIRFLPITSRLCLSVQYRQYSKCIQPLSLDNLADDLKKPPTGKIIHRDADSDCVQFINQLVIQSAEDFVFSSIESSDIHLLVKKFAIYRVEPEYVELPTDEPDCIIHGSIIRVREV